MNESKREILFASITGVFAVSAIVAMPLLVASPKLLFGRSLTAIAPSLFPIVTLVLISLLSVGLVLVSLRSLLTLNTHHNITPSEADDLEADEIIDSPENNWLKKGAFFFLLAGYGLLMKPVGFLISSFIVITLTSLLLGNRHWLQIFFLAVVSPVCLYLIATRAMLVSLPELNQIELFYSHSIEWIRGYLSP